MQKFAIKLIRCAAAIVIVSTTASFADSPNSRSKLAVVRGSTLAELPVLASGKIHTVGAVEIFIHEIYPFNGRAYFRKNGDLIPDSREYFIVKAQARGGRIGRRKSVSLSGVIAAAGNSQRLTFPAIPLSGSRHRLPALELFLKSNSKFAVARLRNRPSSSIAKKMNCSSESTHTDLIDYPHLTPAIARLTKLVKVATVSAEADYDWHLIHGSSSNEAMLQALVGASQFFEVDVALSFEPATLITNIDAIPELASPSATDLLLAFNSYIADGHLGESDLKHLFTGKELQPFGTAGKAFQATFCSAPSFATSLSMDLSTLINPKTVAHEIGHNFGAEHTPFNESPPSLMYPSLSAATHFAPASVAQIVAYLESVSYSCLGSKIVEIAPTPSPTPTPLLPTPTPIPTFTSTPTPFPTATESSTPSVKLLKAKVFADGNIRLNITVDDASECSTTLSVARPGSVARIPILDLPGDISSFQINVPVKNIPKIRSVTFELQISCPSISLSRAPVTTVVKIPRYLKRNGLSLVSFNRWAKTVARKLL